MATAPPRPVNERERLQELASLALLDTPPEPSFDRITRLAAAVSDCPIALVSLVDASRQWFKSRVGLDAPETPRDQSFCGHAILEPQPMIVRDALADPRFADNPLVLGAPHIRFYAGVPIMSRGHAIGTLCVIDAVPREPTATAIARLVDLARLVEDELELRRIARAAGGAPATFRDIVDTLPVALVVHRDGHVLYCNRAAAQLGELEHPDDLVGRRTADFIAPVDQPAAAARADLVQAHGTVAPERDFHLRTMSGRDVLVTATAVPVQLDGAVAAATTMRDVTRLRALEAESRTAIERIAEERAIVTSTLASIQDGVALLSAERTLLYANPAYYALLGLSERPERPYTRADLAEVLAARSDDPDLLRAAFMAASEPGAPAQVRVFELSRPRRTVLERRTVPALGSGTQVVVWRDITAQEDLALERARLAHTDPLTQVLNRRGLEALLPRERARAHRAGRGLSVIVFDLDHFKALNDTLGHAVGDRVLVDVARLITAVCRATDLVVRWGGEEFVVVLDVDVAGAFVLAERVRTAVATSHVDDGSAGAAPRPYRIPITLSGGVATLADRDEPIERAIERADALMYKAKRDGRNRIARPDGEA